MDVRGDGDHPAGGTLLQEVQEEVGEKEVSEVVGTEDEMKVVLGDWPVDFNCDACQQQSQKDVNE